MPLKRGTPLAHPSGYALASDCVTPVRDTLFEILILDILRLQRRYPTAVTAREKVLKIDPRGIVDRLRSIPANQRITVAEGESSP